MKLPTLRFGGQHFATDADFLNSGRQEAIRLRRLGLRDEHSILEIGCGTGRLVYGLQGLDSRARYLGIDVHQPAIVWCRDNLADPDYQFEYVDVRNDRYNPDGKAAAQLPGQHDFVYAYSVFSHLLPADVAAHAAEIARVLMPGGLMFLTAFVEQGVPAVEVNPDGYVMKWEGPLHCVRYELLHFLHAFSENGLYLESLNRGTETDGQTALLFRKVA